MSEHRGPRPIEPDDVAIDAPPEVSSESEQENEGPEEQSPQPAQKRTKVPFPKTGFGPNFQPQIKQATSSFDDDFGMDRKSSRNTKTYSSQQSSAGISGPSLSQRSNPSSYRSDRPRLTGPSFRHPGREVPAQDQTSAAVFITPRKDDPSSPSGIGSGSPRKRKRSSVEFSKPPDLAWESRDPPVRFQVPPQVPPSLPSGHQFEPPPQVELESPTTSGFKLPPGGETDNIEHDVTRSPISPPKLLINLSSDAVQATEQSSPRCLICKSPIPTDLFDEFLQHHGKRFLPSDVPDLHLAAASVRWPYRFQAMLHRLHRQESALREWVAKGYPRIDWESLAARVARHRTALVQILERKLPSEARDRYERRVAEEGDLPAAQAYLMSGRKKAMASELSDDRLKALAPGYYGLRGAQMILDAMEGLLEEPLARARKKDRLVARATVAYLQEVMVPEAGWRLIMDDLSLDEGRAKEVMKESAAIGMLVHSGEEGLGSLEEDKLSGDGDEEEEELEEDELDDEDD